MCHLGWQESLVQLAQVVEPDLSGRRLSGECRQFFQVDKDSDNIGQMTLSNCLASKHGQEAMPHPHCYACGPVGV